MYPNRSAIPSRSCAEPRGTAMVLRDVAVDEIQKVVAGVKDAARDHSDVNPAGKRNALCENGTVPGIRHLVRRDPEPDEMLN